MCSWYVKLILHLLHFNVYPQSLHITNVEYPLLFKNRIICFLFFKFSSIFSYNLLLIIDLFPFANSSLKSTISTFGRLELFALLVSFINSISPLCALVNVPISGVALPQY